MARRGGGSNVVPFQRGIDLTPDAAFDVWQEELQPYDLEQQALDYYLANPKKGLLFVEDNRRFSPYTIGPRTYYGRSPNVVASNYNEAGLSFSPASRTVRCIRRKARREVMFAKGTRALGKGARRRRRRNFWSDVRC